MAASPVPDSTSAPHMTSPFESYRRGQHLQLVVTENHLPEEFPLSRTISAIITELIYPRNDSCCMLMDIQLEGLVYEGILLKLYDRRFATRTRQGLRASDWNLAVEINYIQALEQAGFERILYEVRAAPKTSGNAAASYQVELVAALFMENKFSRETTAYKLLGDIQGHYVPHHIANVGLPLRYRRDDGTLGESFSVRGILLQFIKGYQLSSIVSNARPEEWIPISDEVNETIDSMAEHGVANSDKDMSSYIVVTSEGPSHQVFRVGLAHSFYHGPEASGDNVQMVRLRAELEREAIDDQMRAVYPLTRQ